MKSVSDVLDQLESSTETFREVVAAFQALVDNYIAKKYPRKTASVSA